MKKTVNIFVHCNETVCFSQVQEKHNKLQETLNQSQEQLSQVRMIAFLLVD